MSWTPPPVPPPPPATLVEAVQRRDGGRVRAFLALGVAIDERNHSLCVAAADGSVALMRLLLDAGADANTRGGLPLTLAVDGGHLEAVRLLLERGASPDALHGEALRLAAFHERHDIASLLLQHGAAPAQGPPATLPSGQTPGDAPGDDSNKENRSPLAL
jgi:ankyrin repeat protein